MKYLAKVRSKYILKQILEYLNKIKLLQIIRYNKALRKEFDIHIEDYKKESWKIEIELILTEDARGKFINIRKGHESFFKIYFNNNRQERKEQKIRKKDKVGRIKIIIDYQNNAFFGLFKDCKCIKKINFIKFNRNDINNMNLMFFECSSLEEINLSHFNTEKVTKMFKMFYGCTSLKKLDLSKFKTNKLKDMNSMFARCLSLEELNLSNFNTENVEDMNSLFDQCSSLTKLDISSFKTKNVTNMKFMFSQCSSLKELNLSNFNTENVIHMDCMFYECSSLEELDLSNFITNKASDMFNMFGNCSSLKKLNISNFNINDEDISHMFDNCFLLAEIICSEELKKKIKIDEINQYFSSMNIIN